MWSFLFRDNTVASNGPQSIDQYASETIETSTNESIVSCRCGLKPWKNHDLDSEEPTRDCCQYFIQSRQGNFSETTFVCQIFNEFVYKRFHSCCITLLHSAYCSQTRIKSGAANKISKQQQRQRRHRLRFVSFEKPKTLFSKYNF